MVRRLYSVAFNISQFCTISAPQNAKIFLPFDFAAVSSIFHDYPCQSWPLMNDYSDALDISLRDGNTSSCMTDFQSLTWNRLTIVVTKKYPNVISHHITLVGENIHCQPGGGIYVNKASCEEGSNCSSVSPCWLRSERSEQANQKSCLYLCDHTIAGRYFLIESWAQRDPSERKLCEIYG